MSTVTDSDRARPPAARRGRWALAACAILVAGLAISVAGALMWRSSVHARERQTFQTNATDVSGTLQAAVRRDTDFVASLRAVLTLEPHLSPSGDARWLSELEGSRQQLGGLGALVVSDIPAADLASFEAHRDADPAFRALVGGRLEPVTPSGRSRYCLLSGGSADIANNPAEDTLVQGDWCNPASLIGGFRQNGTTRAQFTQAITESGQFAVYRATVGGSTSLIIESAFYREGTPPADAAERRASVLGWILGSFDIPQLLRSALGRHRGLGVTLYHSNPGLAAEPIGQAGVGGHAFTQSSTLSADGTWTAQVTGATALGGPSANVQALAVLLGGAIVSILLCTLMLVLTRSRESALAMVEEKTGQLRHQALHDSLTSLPNRVLALEHAAQMLARARRAGRPVAALYVDVDGFKRINDTFGHAAGDELLRQVAARLATVVREGDTAARLGGDEFVVLVEGSTLDAGPELVAERLLDTLRRPYDLGADVGRELTVTASVGIAFGLSESPDELLRDADLALYEAKGAGRDRYALFASSMQTAAHDRLTMQLDLAHALDRGQLFLLYQPTFDLQSERVSGLEALLRWRHPERGLLTPSDFLATAEESGLIVPIGRWVLREACAQAAHWREQGYEVAIAVNVSGRQLEDGEFAGDVRDALSESALPAGALTLEIAETTLMRDAEASAERLQALKALGVRIAIDDFGSAYSSLAQLRRFPVDALKIDRAFLRGVADSGRSAGVIGTLVALGRMLEIETLAEGIEEEAQLESAQREQCDHGQGFLLSRALDAEAVAAFLAGAGARAQPQPAG